MFATLEDYAKIAGFVHFKKHNKLVINFTPEHIAKSLQLGIMYKLYPQLR